MTFMTFFFNNFSFPSTFGTFSLKLLNKPWTYLSRFHYYTLAITFLAINNIFI